MNVRAAAIADTAPLPVPIEERLIVALDVPSREEALQVVEELGDSVVFYKIGLQLQFAGGLELARELIARGKKIFLDSKLFDIDQTVRGAAQNVAEMGVDFLTVHGNGKAIRAALAGRGGSKLKILSVTVLTSLDGHDMEDLGLSCTVAELVMHRARRALEAGCDGVIASGEEAEAIRSMANGGLLIVTPGIRSQGVPHHDQKRVASPSDAISAGADYLVVGRQILDATDRKAMVEQIFGEIREALAAR